jgi:hypothetical protein
MTWIFVALYFLPPIGAMFVGPQMAIYNKVWLFNLVSLFFWPILIWFIPSTYR